MMGGRGDVQRCCSATPRCMDQYSKPDAQGDGGNSIPFEGGEGGHHGLLGQERGKGIFEKNHPPHERPT